MANEFQDQSKELTEKEVAEDRKGLANLLAGLATSQAGFQSTYFTDTEGTRYFSEPIYQLSSELCLDYLEILEAYMSEKALPQWFSDLPIIIQKNVI